MPTAPTTNSAPTLTDVARRAGVSKVTASVVLNGARSGTRVSEETRARVEAAAAELHYHPNAMARALARARTETIGVLFGRVTGSVMTNPYTNRVLQGVFAEAGKRNFDVHVFTAPWEGATRSARRYRDGRTDGLIVVSPFTDTDMMPALAENNLPLVAVCWESARAGVTSVDVDNAGGVALAIEHLVGLGHRRIAHVMGDENYVSALVRRAAFRDALHAHGLEELPGYVQPGSYRGGAIISESTRRLFAQPEPPTAVFAANDAVAEAVIMTARALGLRVPDDLSVVGFNNTDYAVRVDPPLTTIHEPLDEMGALATQLLLEALEGKEHSQRDYRLLAQLVVRSSTAPPPAR